MYWIVGLISGGAAVALVLAYRGRPMLAWLALGLAGLTGWRLLATTPGIAWTISTTAFALVSLVSGVPSIRRQLLTRPLLPRLRTMLPNMSETERAALDAGTVWWDGELFSGRPDWSRWFELDLPGLTSAERAFLEGPVEDLCALLDDHAATASGDLPPEVWAFLRERRFFGMIIPVEYGGLGFSARAHSEVVAKLASRSTAAAVTAMVPNSLGPAELILHYGTEEQKSYYLPRLAAGIEIPCFALTEPRAGSDATAIESEGIVRRIATDGREEIGVVLQWNKRYITLAPAATLLGLAFRLRDPENLLGRGPEPGITCALVPTELPGVDIGARHDPLGVPFLNGTTHGRDVVIALDRIIGGPERAGQGWAMLMQSLSAGRGVSLPSLSAGATQLCTRTAGAYASVREQFRLPIGRFEGVSEALARIGGTTYWIDAVRRVTAGAVDLGERPSVVSAIAKCYTSEAMRRVVNDSMDVLGGAGIVQGPRNAIGRLYRSLPIGITVEGANILTRTMIVFGQGALRCHPHARHELAAAASGDVAALDRHLFAHLAFAGRNAARSFVLGWTDGRLAGGATEVCSPDLRRHLQRMTRLSAVFALVADAAMGTLGGALKRREALTGRLADAIAWLYIGSAAAKRFHDEGAPEELRPYARWAFEESAHQVERALDAALRSLPGPLVRAGLRPLAFPRGAHRYPGPNDALMRNVADGILEDRPAVRLLTSAVYDPPRTELGLGQLLDALETSVAARAAEKKIACRQGAVAGRVGLSPEETAIVERARHARDLAIAVDTIPGPGRGDRPARTSQSQGATRDGEASVQSQSQNGGARTSGRSR